MDTKPREGLVIDRAKAVTLFPSYYKTTLSIGLVTGFEPPTYRSYATICSLSFVNFRGSFMVYDGKTTYIFFSLIRRCLFFSMNVYLIALVVISGCVLQPSIFGGGGGGIVCHRVACFDDGARRCVQEKQRDVTPHSPQWTPETCRLVMMLKSQYKNTTGKINQSDGSNTRSWSAACRMRARRVPIYICSEVITNTRGILPYISHIAMCRPIG